MNEKTYLELAGSKRKIPIHPFWQEAANDCPASQTVNPVAGDTCGNLNCCFDRFAKPAVSKAAQSQTLKKMY